MQDAAMSSQVFWFLVHRDLSSVPLLGWHLARPRPMGPEQRRAASMCDALLLVHALLRMSSCSCVLAGCTLPAGHDSAIETWHVEGGSGQSLTLLCLQL